MIRFGSNFLQGNDYVFIRMVQILGKPLTKNPTTKQLDVKIECEMRTCFQRKFGFEKREGIKACRLRRFGTLKYRKKREREITATLKKIWLPQSTRTLGISWIAAAAQKAMMCSN